MVYLQDYWGFYVSVHQSFAPYSRGLFVLHTLNYEVQKWKYMLNSSHDDSKIVCKTYNMQKNYCENIFSYG